MANFYTIINIKNENLIVDYNETFIKLRPGEMKPNVSLTDIQLKEYVNLGLGIFHPSTFFNVSSIPAWNYISDWEAAVDYIATAPISLVTYLNGLYLCISSHRSKTLFEPEKWKLLTFVPRELEYRLNGSNFQYKYRDQSLDSWTTLFTFADIAQELRGDLDPSITLKTIYDMFDQITIKSVQNLETELATKKTASEIEEIIQTYTNPLSTILSTKQDSDQVDEKITNALVDLKALVDTKQNASDVIAAVNTAIGSENAEFLSLLAQLQSELDQDESGLAALTTIVTNINADKLPKNQGTFAQASFTPAIFASALKTVLDNSVIPARTILFDENNHARLGNGATGGILLAEFADVLKYAKLATSDGMLYSLAVRR